MSGKEKVLYSFAGGADGAFARSGLVDVKGTLYGTTLNGGGYANLGTVSKITTTGSEKVLCRFGGAGNGYWLTADLANVNGRLYGMTEAGSAYRHGTIFTITTSGSETVVHSFAGSRSDWATPKARLVNASDMLFGTTRAGGEYRVGSVFALTP